jgi:uncharacterized protein
MTAESRIGFHAAYDKNSGKETGVGNALVGAYLNKIGLPYSAVVYITQASPDSMTWLSVVDAERQGIDVEPFGSPRVVGAPSPERLDKRAKPPSTQATEPAVRPPRDGIAAYGRGDYAAALRLLPPLALQGDPLAKRLLGFMYSEGKGTPQDFEKAAGWFWSAAEMGDAASQAVLGGMYIRGEGVARNYVQAHKWLNLAATRLPASGRDDIVRLRDEVAARMTRTEIVEAQRLAREWNPR